MVGKALGSTRRRGSGDGGGVNSLRTCRFDGSSMRWICATILGCCGFDASMAMTVLLFAGDGGGVRRKDGACEGRRCNLLGDCGLGDCKLGEYERRPSFIRKGDGGASPRSRLEKRRNSDFFLESGCGDSRAIVFSITPPAILLIMSWL